MTTLAATGRIPLSVSRRFDILPSLKLKAKDSSYYADWSSS